ncbi:MAG: hypothetical protein P1Q69_07750 [Candidatus Thorarchaeota archaeon]|nr:hypothetical protein [Candidatus Thorarchaeota archaeon]
MKAHRIILVILFISSLSLSLANQVYVTDSFVETFQDGENFQGVEGHYGIIYPGRADTGFLDISLEISEGSMDILVIRGYIDWSDYESDPSPYFSPILLRYNTTSINESLFIDLQVYTSIDILTRPNGTGGFTSEGYIIAHCDYERPLITLPFASVVSLAPILFAGVLVSDVILSRYIFHRRIWFPSASPV